MSLFSLDTLAILSECGTYRYQLWRYLPVQNRPAKTVVFVGVNPSTADGHVDDATIRKMRGFANRWECTRLGVLNLFAYRATDVRELHQQFRRSGHSHEAVIGPDNPRHLKEVLALADIVVPCWGDRLKIPKKLRPQIELVRHNIGRIKPEGCFVLGLTQGGEPRHPLRLGYDTPLERWAP